MANSNEIYHAKADYEEITGGTVWRATVSGNSTGRNWRVVCDELCAVNILFRFRNPNYPGRTSGCPAFVSGSPASVTQDKSDMPGRQTFAGETKCTSEGFYDPFTKGVIGAGTIANPSVDKQSQTIIASRRQIA